MLPRLLPLVILGFVALCGQLRARPLDSAAVLLGRVTEQRSNEPFEGVVVELVGQGVSDTTDARGAYALVCAQAGTYQLVLHVPVWGDFTRTITLARGSSTTVDVSIWPGLHLDMEGVIAYYPLDGNAVDLGPNSWHGVNHEATSVPDRMGRAGAAMHFDGRTQRIEVAHHDRLNQLPLSVAFWVRAETGVADPSMWIGKYMHPDGDGWCMFYEYKRMCAGYFRDQFGNSARSHAGYEADGKWHHVVVTMDTIGTVIHFDDARVPQVIAYHKTPTPTLNTEPMYIGYLNSRIGTPGLLGDVDDLYIFDHVLSDEEIEQLRKK